MDTEKQAELVRLYNKAHDTANVLRAQAAEAYEMSKELAELTKDTLDCCTIRLPNERLGASVAQYRRLRHSPFVPGWLRHVPSFVGGNT